MNLLTVEQLRYLKRNHFSATQKTLCKKFEQKGGSFNFFINGVEFRLKYKASKAYTNYIFRQLKHNDVGVMNRGGGPLLQDRYGKVNYEEDKIARKIDKKQL
tara:strand:- start:266 stop:571 length:306 start_codon:yes stop_codon:yes gene_type:complete